MNIGLSPYGFPAINTKRVPGCACSTASTPPGADGDARGVVVGLTDCGVNRLKETAPVHLRGASDLFVAQHDDQELAALETILNKVTVDCTFG